MRMLFGTALVVSAMLAAAPAFAQLTKSFDGTYTKVSATPVGGGTPQSCPPATDAQLVISGGIGRMIWGDAAVFSGWVDPQGMLTLQAPNGPHVDAQIEAKGTIKATVKFPTCSYAMVWQKKS
jgi:hypothetical protein